MQATGYKTDSFQDTIFIMELLEDVDFHKDFQSGLNEMIWLKMLKGMKNPSTDHISCHNFSQQMWKDCMII